MGREGREGPRAPGGGLHIPIPALLHLPPCLVGKWREPRQHHQLAKQECQGSARRELGVLGSCTISCCPHHASGKQVCHYSSPKDEDTKYQRCSIEGTGGEIVGTTREQKPSSSMQ